MTFPIRSLPFTQEWEQPAPKRAFPLASGTVAATDKSGVGRATWSGFGTVVLVPVSQWYNTDANEVFAWPEMSLYLWNAGASALIPSVENVSLSYEKEIEKYLFDGTATPYAARSRYVEKGQNVQLTIGAMFAGASIMQLMKSGVNISGVVSMVNGMGQATAEFVVRSARAPLWQLDDNAGAIWRQQIRLVAADVIYQGASATG